MAKLYKKCQVTRINVRRSYYQVRGGLHKGLFMIPKKRTADYFWGPAVNHSVYKKGDNSKGKNDNFAEPEVMSSHRLPCPTDSRKCFVRGDEWRKRSGKSLRILLISKSTNDGNSAAKRLMKTDKKKQTFSQLRDKERVTLWYSPSFLSLFLPPAVLCGERLWRTDTHARTSTHTQGQTKRQINLAWHDQHYSGVTSLL